MVHKVMMEFEGRLLWRVGRVDASTKHQFPPDSPRLFLVTMTTVVP